MACVSLPRAVKWGEFLTPLRFMQPKLFHRSSSFISACCVALVVLGIPVIQAAEFKPLLTVQIAGPSTLISIAEKVGPVVGVPAEALTAMAPYKNMLGVNAAGNIGLAFALNEGSPLGADAIVSLPISNFLAFSIPGMESGLMEFRSQIRRDGSKYIFASGFGNIVAFQKQGFLVIATEGAADFAATVDPRTLFAEVSEFTFGVHVNLEETTEETIAMLIGQLSLVFAMQGMHTPDVEELSKVVAEQLKDMAAITWGMTIDPQTLNIASASTVVAKPRTELADKFVKSKDAMAKTKMGAFLPDTPQTVFAWHILNYCTDTEIDTLKTMWEGISEGLLEGISEVIEDGEGDEKQLEKLIAAAEAFIEYMNESIDFFAREKLIDSAYWFDSEGTLIVAIATSKTAEAVALDEKFFGTLLDIFEEDGVKTFIEGKVKKNYDTANGYSLSCIPNLFADLPEGIDIPEKAKLVLANIPLNLFWAVKENETLVYAVGLDFDKTEQALKTAMSATPTPPKQTAVFAVKPLVDFVLNTWLPLAPKEQEAALEPAKQMLADVTKTFNNNSKVVYAEEYTTTSFTQKVQAPGELVIAFFEALLKPAVSAAQRAATRIQCSNNMKQLGLALHIYHDARNGLPPLYTVDADGKPLHSWRVLLLPYMEQQALYERIRLDEPWDSSHNRQFHNIAIAVYSCPDNPLVAPGKACTYVAIDGALRPALPANGQRSRDTFAYWTDGTSNQIVFTEVKQPFNWMDPTADITLDELAKGINKTGRVGSFHSPGAVVGGCNVGIGDGSVRFVTDTIDGAILRALGDPADGKTTTLP